MTPIDSEKEALTKELGELKAANIKKDGTPRQDAVPQELVRITEIEELLTAPAQGSDDKPKEPEPTLSKNDQDDATGETDADKLDRLEKENKALKAERGRGRDAAKIQRAEGQAKVGYVPRPDEIMGEAFDDAMKRHPDDWDDAGKMAVERTIRKYVRKGGVQKNPHKEGEFYDLPAGFIKGIPMSDKVYALKLLAMMGRLSKSVAEVTALLEEREKLTPARIRQTNRDFNEHLESLGVSWDEDIQVLGMSPVLKAGT